MKIYHTAGLTDTGIKRELNEDYFVTDDDLGLLIVADGMGGHEAGEVASKEAAQVIHQYLKSSKDAHLSYINAVVGDNADNNKTWDDLPNPLLTVVEEAIDKANAEINQANKDLGFSDDQGMGTTIVGLWVLEQLEMAVVFHVGDSRLYLLRDNHLGQITTDQSLYQLWIDNGRIGPEPPKNIILSGMGLRQTVESKVRLLAIKPKDVFLLCSDGLSDLVSDDEIAESLRKVTEENIDPVCEALIEKANQSGGTDNITVSLALMSQ